MVRRSLFEGKYAPVVGPQNVKKMSMKRQFTPSSPGLHASALVLPAALSSVPCVSCIGNSVRDCGNRFGFAREASYMESRTKLLGHPGASDVDCVSARSVHH